MMGSMSLVRGVSCSESLTNSVRCHRHSCTWDLSQEKTRGAWHPVEAPLGCMASVASDFIPCCAFYVAAIRALLLSWRLGGSALANPGQGHLEGPVCLAVQGAQDCSCSQSWHPEREPKAPQHATGWSGLAQQPHHIYGLLFSVPVPTCSSVRKGGLLNPQSLRKHWLALLMPVKTPAQEASLLSFQAPHHRAKSLLFLELLQHP